MAKYTPEEIAAVMENGSPRDKAALQAELNRTGNFAQTFNQQIANHGVRAGATQVPNLSTAPPKADSAPNATSITVFTGLCDGLNSFQQYLVKEGKYEVADVYEVIFDPDLIGSASVKIKSGTVYNKTPMADSKNAKAQLDSDTDSMNTTARTVNVTAGTQIIQFIDQVVRSSTYITDQANVIIDENTGQAKPNPKAQKGAGLKWYKISFQSKQLQYDNKRNDYAYKMTFMVNKYDIVDIQSQYFAPGKMRGVHKQYNYWFTGENTQVLSFEQEYDNTYYQILVTAPEGTDKKVLIPEGIVNSEANFASGVPAPSRAYVGDAGQSSQYADEGANKIGASAADWLYSMSKNSRVHLRIVGDPAWMMQAEATNSLNKDTITYDPFLPDGTINMDVGQVLFGLNFNRPGDYDYMTGLVNPNAPMRNVDGSLSTLQPQARLVYIATKMTSTFNAGKFEQDLEGTVYLQRFLDATAAAKEAAGRTGLPTFSSNAQESPEVSRLQSASNTDPADVAAFTQTRQPNLISPAVADLQSASNSSPTPSTQDDQGYISEPSLESQSQAGPPTSNGDIEPTVNNTPPTLNVNDTNNVTQASTGVEYNASEIAARDAYYAAGKPTSGPIYEAAVAAKSDYARRVADLNSSIASTPNTQQTMAPKEA